MRRFLRVVVMSAAALAGGCAAEQSADAAEGDGATPAAQLFGQRKLSALPFGCKGSKVALETYNGRNYLSAVLGGGWSTMANASSVGKFETFKAYDLGDDRVALQVSNGNYLVADPGGILLNANASSIGTNSVFKLSWSKNGDWLYLRSAQGKYVTAEGGGGGVANSAWLIIGNNQGFKAICIEGDETDSSSTSDESIDRPDQPDPWGGSPQGPTRGGSRNDDDDDVSSAGPGLGG